MVAFTSFVLTYLLGGITFLPLLLTAVFLHWKYGSQKTTNDAPTDADAKAVSRAIDLSDTPAELPEELKKYVQSRRHEADVAAGYFAVCREYVPGGVNGKPPERTTPAGAVVANESPSVYQSMYRGIFGRDKNAAPTIQNEPGKGSIKLKKGRNVFYVVLRLGHLMLYDDAEQLEVRHVISLAHHGVDIYGGGEIIPEGELFVKRNCIRLTSKRIAGELSSESKPFYLFSDNCSEKEDFYHALLQNQERREGSLDNPPKPLQFEQAHLIKLVQQLHASEENLQTRWINALLGRVFLGMYKTPDVEAFIRSKITKKIARVQKPNFISSITVGKMSMGDAAPFFTNPKLRELTMAGDVTVEADVKYNGGFRIEVMAVARIDLGKRMGGVREFNLLLAVVAKKVEGHVMFRIKPPPSNRIWFSFETVPKLDISIEPVVAQRQIKYGFVLRAIESRIREVLAETLVSPNWDDVPFHQTFLQRFRGGIWQDDVRADTAVTPETLVDDAGEGLEESGQLQEDVADDSQDGVHPLSDQGKTMSSPFLANTAPQGLTIRNRAASRTTPDLTNLDGGASTSIESERTASLPRNGASMPRALRTQSFTNSKAAEPMLHSEPITIGSKERSASGGATSLKGLNAHQSLSRSGSPHQSPVGSPERSAETAEAMRQAMRSKHGSLGSTRSSLSMNSQVESAASRDDFIKLDDGGPDSSAPSTRTSIDSVPAQVLQHLRSGSTDTQDTGDANSINDKDAPLSLKQAKRAATLKALGTNAAEKRQSLNAAAAAAKRWGLGVIAARQNAKGTGAGQASTRPSTATNLDGQDSEPVEGDAAADDVAEPVSDVPVAEDTSTTPTAKRTSRVMELEKDNEKAPSPSLIPRRIGSTHSLSSTSSTSTNKPQRQPSPKTSKIPMLSPTASTSSLNKSPFPQGSVSPSLTASNFSNASLAPSQQEIDARVQTAHSRSSSTGGVITGPGSPSMPLGRGQPLPPPGKPLPGPKSGTWVGAAGAMLSGMRRKPVGAPEVAGKAPTDESRQHRKSGTRSELEAQRRQYEQEKHIIGASTTGENDAHADTDPDSDGVNGQASTAQSRVPPPLPRRPKPTDEDVEPHVTDASQSESTSNPPLKRVSSIPVTKRPVPKPPLPVRRAEPGQQEVSSQSKDHASQEVEATTEDREDAVQHERLEHLEPDAVLKDEEAFADELADVETGGVEADDDHLDADGDLPVARKAKHGDEDLDDLELDDRHGYAGDEEEDTDEAFGPMEMNAPDSPVKV